MKKGFNVKRAAAIALAAVMALSAYSATCRGQAELEMRQHLVSFFQRGGNFSALPESHPLRPMAELPLTATMSYQLLKDDEATLSYYYPHLYRLVMRRLNPENMTANGLVPGGIAAEIAAGTYISPTLNALAAIEVYSLHFIAFAAEEYEDSHDLLTWSRQLADATTRTFYDPSRNYFFPLDEHGYMKIMYMAGQALPLVLDETLGTGARTRIAEKFQGPELNMNLWHNMDESLVPVAYAFLSHCPEMRGILSRSTPRNPRPGQPSLWFRYWAAGPPAQSDPFPSWKHVSSLMHLKVLIEREDLMDAEQREIFMPNIDSLLLVLERDPKTTDEYIQAINTVNRALGSVSSFAENIKTVANRWRSVREYRWSDLSPRLKRIMNEAIAASIKELNDLKPVLSAKYMEKSDIFSRVVFPTRPISQSRQYEFSAAIMSREDSVSISRLYIGVGEQRWRITADGEEVPLSPEMASFSYTGKVSLPPTMGTGIERVPVYFDFLLSGRRVELHHAESITITRGHDVTLSFPDGKRLIDGSIPVNVILRYNPERQMRGTVEGIFMKELECSPKLPARFTIKKGDDVTSLPLKVSFSPTLSPGRYPFSLRVKLDGKQIAFFEDILDRPIRWFHLGPLSRSQNLIVNGVSYQDDLYKRHGGPSGYQIKWREVPSGAFDIQGAVLPDRLAAHRPDHCSLLYTVIDSPGRLNVVWRLTSGNVSSLWFNGEPAFIGETSPYGEQSGKVELRKGINSIFVSTCWHARADRTLLTLSDESGLPVAGLSNEVEQIVEGFEQLASGDEIEAIEQGAEEQRKEVILELEQDSAKQVCVIGSFNNWKKGASEMQLGPDGKWTIRLLLRPGKHVYKFMIDGETKIPDPKARTLEPDGFGGMNSVLEVE
jgi:hypothetical protein